MVISKIFKFFSKKEIEIQTINKNELNNWIISQTSSNLDKTYNKLGFVRTEILEEKEKTEKNLQSLSVAKLKVKGIPEKAKHIVEGNRKTYLQKVRFFIQGINLPEKLEQIPEFCDSFDKNLDNFSTNTNRNYNILKDIIGEEAATIATNLNNLNNLIKKTKKIIEQSKIKEKDELLNKTKIFQEQVTKKKNLNKNIEIKNLEIKKETSDIKNIEKTIQKIKKEKKYLDYLELIDGKKSLELEIQDLRSNFSQSFSIIIPALKKYERISLDNNLIKLYLDNIILTLLEDKELKIVEILKKMKGSIIKGNIELKDKKIKKILKKIETLDDNHFRNFKTNYNEQKSKLKELIEKIEKIEIIEKIDDLRKKIETVNDLRNNKKRDLDNAQKEIAGINLELLKQNIEQEILEKINLKIKINI